MTKVFCVTCLTSSVHSQILLCIPVLANHALFLGLTPTFHTRAMCCWSKWGGACLAQDVMPFAFSCGTDNANQRQVISCFAESTSCRGRKGFLLTLSTTLRSSFIWRSALQTPQCQLLVTCTKRFSSSFTILAHPSCRICIDVSAFLTGSCPSAWLTYTSKELPLHMTHRTLLLTIGIFLCSFLWKFGFIAGFAISIAFGIQ